MFLRLWHRDRELAAYLKTRGLSVFSPAARAARRLFDDKFDMMAFFQLAWPGAVQEGEHHLLGRGDGGGEVIIDCARVLQSLWEIQATRDDREVAAFLSYWSNQHSTTDPGTTLLLPLGKVHLKDNQQRARQFLDAFRGVSAADLRAVYARESWWNDKLRVWFRACFREGIPADYFVQILAASSLTFGVGVGRHHNADWPSADLGEFYRAGVPAAFIARFWQRRDEFDALRDAGVPYEYAMAMEVSA